MNKNNTITLLSSFSKDRLLDKKGNLLREQNGGPALFISNVLQSENILFILPVKLSFQVDILITKDGEFGKIKEIVKPVTIDWEKINSSSVIISTILEEFSLTYSNTYSGKIFLDIQGYVRDGKDFGSKKIPNFNRKNFTNILCVKGTKEEISYLPTEIVNDQKKRMLLITDGKRGSTLFINNQIAVARPSVVPNLENTIGAGDTFFAYFVSRFLKEFSPEIALTYATEKTTEFLTSSQLHHHTNSL